MSTGTPTAPNAGTSMHEAAAKIGKIKSYRINQHFMAPVTGGTFTGKIFDHGQQRVTSFPMGPACNPTVTSLKGYPCTPEANGVTCAKCRATPVWQAAILALLIEQGTTADDPQWAAFGITPPANVPSDPVPATGVSPANPIPAVATSVSPPADVTPSPATVVPPLPTQPANVATPKAQGA